MPFRVRWEKGRIVALNSYHFFYDTFLRYCKMRKIIKRGYLAITLLLSMPAICQEMVLIPPELSAHTVTRDVTEYTAREQALIAIIGDKENQQMPLLADDFEVWSDKSRDWQSKDDWLKTARQQTNFNIRNLSVRQMDDFAIVNFLLETTDRQDKKRSTQFVVDIWRQSTNKLSVRYISDVEPSVQLNPIDRKF